LVFELIKELEGIGSCPILDEFIAQAGKPAQGLLAACRGPVKPPGEFVEPHEQVLAAIGK
jgi:hypothetical protein